MHLKVANQNDDQSDNNKEERDTYS